MRLLQFVMAAIRGGEPGGEVANAGLLPRMAFFDLGDPLGIALGGNAQFVHRIARLVERAVAFGQRAAQGRDLALGFLARVGSAFGFAFELPDRFGRSAQAFLALLVRAVEVGGFAHCRVELTLDLRRFLARAGKVADEFLRARIERGDLSGAFVELAAKFAAVLDEAGNPARFGFQLGDDPGERFGIGAGMAEAAEHLVEIAAQRLGLFGPGRGVGAVRFGS